MLNIFVLWVAWILILTHIIRPIEQLRALSQSIEQGNLSTDWDYRGRDEIGQIASSLILLATSIKKAREFTKSIGQGNFNTEMLNGSLSNGADQGIFGSLMMMRDQLKAVADSDRKRNWVTKGMAEFTKTLRNNNADLKQLSNKIMTWLVRYLNAHQGALFVLNNENPQETYLELAACYAYEEKPVFGKKTYYSGRFWGGPDWTILPGK
ncbi:MAG: methyl-accepting chemotaxis protein [Bacteroidia bacterium]|nr:methyl-accepting chemotaxis protein [Bacteroidia bacterium]